MGHRPLAWVPAILVGCLALCGCSDDGDPTQSYELSGIVRESLTNARLPGATVSFLSDTLYMASTTTDGDGQYEMVVVTDTPFGQVRAEKDGFLPADQTVYFDSPQRRVDLVLRRAAAME